MFAELLAHPGVVEELEVRSHVGLLAFHGGSLEKGTDDIAREAARRAGASLYAVVMPADLRWHIPSKLFDPACSPSLAAFLEHVDVAVAVHGYGRPDRFTTIMCGGSNRGLAGRLAAALRERLGDYEVVDDLDAVPNELRGLHPDNPVNRPRRGGVQLELPPRVRGLGPYWDRHPVPPGSRAPHTEQVIDALATVAADEAA
jgi:phage replication-related protein YjqB (UPF0714/DUF867 family)